MALNTDKKFITGESARKLVQELNQKNTEQAILLYTDINANAQAISDEESRAVEAENVLKNSIETEVTRAKAAEQTLQQNLDDKESALKIKIDNQDSVLQDNIDAEELARNQAITAVQIDYTQKISALDKAITDSTDGAIATQINTVAGTLRSEIRNVEESLEESVANLTTVVNTNNSNSANAFRSVNDKIDTEIADVRKDIVDHNSHYSTLNQQVQLHISNESNPHKVTIGQIGAASQSDFEELSQLVDVNQSLATNNESRLTAVEPKVEKNISDIEALQIDKVNYSGTDQIIAGGLISEGNFQVIGDTLANGDLRVSGNLIVDGTHQTVDTETLQVQDNFIVVNSDNETLGTAPAGIAIQTGTQPYLIAYDKENESISLGLGHETSGTFSFSEGEKKPILTRANSNQLQDKHLLIWDAETNTAIDGGLYDEESLKDTFATWTAYNTLASEVHQLDNLDLADGPLGRVTVTENNITRIDENIDQIETHDTEQDSRLDAAEQNIENLKATKQNYHDDTLATTAKNIPGAINEVHAELDQHSSDLDNPHEVNWNQIIERGNVFSSQNPLMDGEATPGNSNYVARYDHKHPTDTSRAPLNHASGSTQYGVATTSEYGHVQVDNVITDASENPVQNKIIKKYVDDSIAELDVSATNLQQSETVLSISETDGKISVTKQNIQISQNQVTSLSDDLTAIRNNANRIESESKGRDTELQSNINTVQSNLDMEIDRATTAEATLQSNITSEASTRSAADESLSTKIDTVEINLQNNIDSNSSRIAVLENTIETVANMNESIEQIKETINETNYQRRFVLSFEPELDSVGNVVGYKPIFTTMDDGILE